METIWELNQKGPLFRLTIFWPLTGDQLKISLLAPSRKLKAMNGSHRKW
jgi:hypothetical protein